MRLIASSPESTEGEIPPPPELALGSDPSSSVLYRLARGATEGEPREENLRLENGLELSAAVRPLGKGQAAWWFMPRLAARTPAPAAAPAAKPQTAAQQQAAVPALFRDAPVGVALADENGKIFEANRAFADFFDLPGAGTSRILGDLIEARDKPALADLITKGDDTSTGPIELRPANQPDKHGRAVCEPLRQRRYPLRAALSRRCVRAKSARTEIRPVAEDAGRGPARGRRGARFQQPAHRHHRQFRIPADAPSGGRSLVQGNQRGASERIARGPAGGPAPRLLPQADAAAARARTWRCRQRAGQMLRRLLREGVDLKLEHGSRTSGRCMPTKRSFPTRSSISS